MSAAQPLSYTLRHPLEVRDAAGNVTETITELKLRRLKGRDLRALDGARGQGSMTLALISASAAMPPSQVDLLDAEDITLAGEVVAGFLGGSLPTGVP